MSATAKRSTPLQVGEALPGFPFVDLFAVKRQRSAAPQAPGTGSSSGADGADDARNQGGGGGGSGGGEAADEEWAVQRVECEYVPSALKGHLLLLSAATAAAVAAAALCWST
jgi:hypothetical protein